MTGAGTGTAPGIVRNWFSTCTAAFDILPLRLRERQKVKISGRLDLALPSSLHFARQSSFPQRKPCVRDLPTHRFRAMIGLVLALALLMTLQTGALYLLSRSVRPVRGAKPKRPTGDGPAPDQPVQMESRVWDIVQSHELALQSLRLKVEQLPAIWSEEADRANRAAERAAKAERRSRRRAETESDDGDSDSSDDAGSRYEQGMLPLPARVAGNAPASTVEVARAQLALAALTDPRMRA